MYETKTKSSAFSVICWSGKTYDFAQNCFEPVLNIRWGDSTIRCVPCWRCAYDMFDIFSTYYHDRDRCCHAFCPVCTSVHYHLQQLSPMIWQQDRDVCSSMVMGRRVFLEPSSYWTMEIGSSINSFMFTYNEGFEVRRPLPTPVVKCVVNSLSQDGFVPIFTPITILADACPKVRYDAKSCACIASVMLWQQKLEDSTTMLSHVSLCEYTADWLRAGGERHNPQLDQSVVADLSTHFILYWNTMPVKALLYTRIGLRGLQQFLPLTEEDH